MIYVDTKADMVSHGDVMVSSLLLVMRMVPGSIPIGGLRISHDFQGVNTWLSTAGTWSLHKRVAVCYLFMDMCT